MTKLRVLIVDDEPLARDRLRSLLAGEESVEIIGECTNGNDAVSAIRNGGPDLVFLDIEMPERGGLQVVEQIPADRRPAIIFVTAHDQFAVNAFEIQAVDYLLKPFDRERFQAALRRAQEHIKFRQAKDTGSTRDASSPDLGRKAARLAFKSEGRVVFVSPEEIHWVEAADNYVLLHLADGSRLILRETMTALEERLGEGFIRINRSAIVRLEQVKELEPTFHGDYTVILRGGTRLPLSRNQRGQLAKFLAAGS